MKASSAGFICLFLSAGLMITASIAQPSSANDKTFVMAKPSAIGPMEVVTH